MEFINTLEERNAILYWFGLINLMIAVVLTGLSILKPIEFGGTNAWFKPIKFALSIGILAWTMSWYTGYLEHGMDIDVFNWVFVVSLGFEIVYISIQAGRGEASHFNLSNNLYSFLYVLMAAGATAASLAVGYIGLKFFAGGFPELPGYYLWAIRIGILLFVIFSLEGFLMGSRLAHTVGGEDGGQGLPFLNWSRIFGDLRVAHFMGMHALQVLPLLAWYLFKDLKLTLAGGVIYALLAVYVLIQALQAKPFLKILN
jgi:hypothetical protein